MVKNAKVTNSTLMSQWTKRKLLRHTLNLCMQNKPEPTSQIELSMEHFTPRRSALSRNKTNPLQLTILLSKLERP